MHPIVNSHIDENGLWKIQAVVDETESVFLTFETEPTQEMVNNVVEGLIAQRKPPYFAAEFETIDGCSAWQFRKALNSLGMRETVESMIAACGDQNVKDGWEYATTFYRYDPLILQFAAVLNYSTTDLDNLFTLARSL